MYAVIHLLLVWQSSLILCVCRCEELNKEVAVLKEKIHHLDDMLKCQQRKVRHMIEQVFVHTAHKDIINEIRILRRRTHKAYLMCRSGVKKKHVAKTKKTRHHLLPLVSPECLT